MRHFLLIFTATKKSELDAWVGQVLAKLECSEKKHYVYRFDSLYDKDGKGTIEQDGVFALIGMFLG